MNLPPFFNLDTANFFFLPPPPFFFFFFSDQKIPRPESAREDTNTAAGLSAADQARVCRERERRVSVACLCVCGAWLCVCVCVCVCGGV